MAFQAKIIIPLDKHLIRNGPMGLMADRATFPQRLVLVNHRPRLLAMAFGARLVQPRHAGSGPHAQRRAMRRLENVRAVRIMALDAVHSALDDWMMLRQLKLGMDVQVAGEACLRVAARVYDMSSAAAGLDVQACGPVARLASRRLAVRRAFEAQTGMWTCRKCAGEFGVTFDAGFIANEGCSFYLRGSDHTARHGRTGSQNQSKQAGACH
jgi:hypothetical protein